MFEVFVILLLIVPPVLAAALVRTRWWWIPGTGLLVGSMIPIAFWDTSRGHDAVDALAGIGNFMLLVMMVVMALYGLVVLGLTSAVHKRKPPPPPPPPSLPEARIV